MRDNRTPIERMIDDACGYVPGQTPAAGPYDTILRCPTCKDYRRGPRHPSDPAGTAVILFKCPRCMNVNPSDDLIYLDKNGKEIKP